MRPDTSALQAVCRPLSTSTATLGESPIWDDRRQAIWWIDTRTCRIFMTQPDDGRTSIWTTPSPPCSIGLCTDERLIVAIRDGIHLFDPANGTFSPFTKTDCGWPEYKLNDGKVSPDGRFFVGSMRVAEPKDQEGCLYRIDPDGSVTKVASGFRLPNGLAWSPDGRTMYGSDSRAGTIWAWDYDATLGELSHRRIFAQFDDESFGRPDGSAVDCDGHYWSAGVFAGRLNRFSPTGSLVEVCECPVIAPTMPCFGGPDLSTLYITSLRPADCSENSDDGRLLEMTTRARGVPISRFAI